MHLYVFYTIFVTEKLTQPAWDKSEDKKES